MSIFKKDGEWIVTNEQLVEFYIPLSYYDGTVRRLATEKVDGLNVFGVFQVSAFKDGKLLETRILNLPIIIHINTFENEVRNIKMLNGETEKCMVYKYIKGSKVMRSFIVVDDENGKNYLTLILQGKLPRIIPYSRTNDLWNKNLKLSDVNFGMNAAYLEALLGRVYRDKNNPTRKYALAYNEGAGDYGYIMASTRQLCKYDSTFSAITYEDFDTALATSLNRTRNKIQETNSPVEPIMKY